jgi:hypothetical protein
VFRGTPAPAVRGKDVTDLKRNHFGDSAVSDITRQEIQVYVAQLIKERDELLITSA